MDPARPSSQLSTDARRPPRILVLLIGLGVLVGAVGLLLPLLAGDGGEDPERAAVVSRASDFAVTYNTYDVAEKADYQERMRELLTESYYGEFTQVTDAVFNALESKDQRSGNAEVLSVAVDSIDEDSAVALVAVNADITTAQDDAAVQRRFRWSVTFAKEDGQWRVSQFESVAPLDAVVGEEAEPGTTPEGGTEGDAPAPDAPGDPSEEDER